MALAVQPHHPQDGRENELVQDPRFLPFLNSTSPRRRPSGAATTPRQHATSRSPTPRSTSSPSPARSSPTRTATSPSPAASSTSARARPALGRPQRPASPRRLRRHRLDHATANAHQPDAEYTLWVFPNQALGPPRAHSAMPAAHPQPRRWTASRPRLRHRPEHHPRHPRRSRRHAPPGPSPPPSASLPTSKPLREPPINRALIMANNHESQSHQPQNPL